MIRLSDEQRFDWLRLIRSENFGPASFRTLINRYGGASRALEALPELSARGGMRRRIKIAPEHEIAQELKIARRIGARFIALGEPEYPSLL
ncbi:MAG TPA: DNA-protecting protein DprA, partial [Rhizobiales bacterium]|nr:DNA-protecting protein DprA [Hyphomicrobiales bacterium]